MPLHIVPDLIEALKEPLPGDEAHRLMVSYDRPTVEKIYETGQAHKEGAVLILLYPQGNELHTVMILRPSYDGVHSNQVGFPGGKKEKQDIHLKHTAVREAEEEIGILPEKVQLIGKLSQIFIPPSNFMVFPFLAYTEEKPEFIPDPKEVEKIIQTPVETLLQEENIKKTRIKVQSVNTYLKVPYFDVKGYIVWGATAMMISELRWIWKKRLKGNW